MSENKHKVATDALETLGTHPIPDNSGRDAILIDLVQSGQKFWLVVFPRQITSLRHVWSHPAFPEEATYHVESDEHYVAPSPAEKWLREYADKIDEPFEALIEGADTWVRNGSYFYGSPCGEPGDVYFGNLEGIGTDPDFWPHYEAYRQTTVPADKQRSFFTCSC